MPPERVWRAAVRTVGTLVGATLSAAAIAGPPFVSDDPEPTDPGRWEIYTFVSGTVVGSETAGEAGFDINYGAARDLQLTAVVPLDYRHAARTDVGLGGVELAAKYRFLHQSDGSPLPDLAFFPRLLLPTAGRTFGTARLGVFLPLWGQKDAGKWSLFGGGGYTVNPGAGQRDFWLEGIGVSQSLGDRLSLGAEVFHQSRDADDAHAFTGVNLGALYRLSRHWSVIGAAGPGLEHARQQGQATFYLALKADY